MKKLRKHFHKMPVDAQHKDLLKSKRVIKQGKKQKKQIEEWKKNPKAYDIRGIDTQPKELIDRRLEFVHKHVGAPKVQKRKFRWKRKDGVFEYHYNGLGTSKIPSQGRIRVDTSYQDKNDIDRIYAHELGHAYDRNIKNKKDRSGFYDFHTLGRNSKKLRNEVIKITKKINPYDEEQLLNPLLYRDGEEHIRYRKSNKEMFADWHSAFIMDKNIVKKGKSFYNIFKNQEKEYVKGLKDIDKEVTSKYVKAPKKKKKKLKTTKNKSKNANKNTNKKKKSNDLLGWF
ncbi:hypothetical protein J2127_001067 [Methanococcus voltae]|uniref:hypothetical protein n=1 Tax=Methanococcus voltae TaxID=2188 RepID=UPI001AE1C81F|nr:hypothetical protein [Methanococcus voltae]MBP2143898.1 hypothetical protein [Methanococcus voltae]